MNVEDKWDVGLDKYDIFVKKVTNKRVMIPHTNLLYLFWQLDKNDEYFIYLALKELLENFAKFNENGVKGEKQNEEIIKDLKKQLKNTPQKKDCVKEIKTIDKVLGLTIEEIQYMKYYFTKHMIPLNKPEKKDCVKNIVGCGKLMCYHNGSNEILCGQIFLGEMRLCTSCNTSNNKDCVNDFKPCALCNEDTVNTCPETHIRNTSDKKDNIQQSRENMTVDSSPSSCSHVHNLGRSVENTPDKKDCIDQDRSGIDDSCAKDNKRSSK